MLPRPEPPPTYRTTQAAYWRGILLLLWFLVSFGLAWFAEPLAQINFAGWPLAFYLAAQGALLIYLVIIVVYVWRMQRPK